MQVIACQLDLAWEDKAANFASARNMLRAAAVQAGALIVLPEMFSTGFSMNVAAVAEDEQGPTHLFYAELARELGAFVLGGVVTRSADGRGSNVAVAVGPDGKTRARYAKLHPFSFGGETKHYAAGKELALFDCGEFRVAPLVCYDLRFPEAFRIATRRGANVLVVIANWPQPREAHWLALLKARAIENQAYVIGVNRVGDDPKLAYGGRSQILDPRGEILADAGSSVGLISAEIELAPLTEYRRQFPALADMRDDLFPAS
jgi:predicted amidohydrolase